MIEVSGVSVHYPLQDRSALDAVTLLVQPGEVLALAGANGSGKSTLAALLCASRLPDGGWISVDGIDPSSGTAQREEVRRLVGRVAQDPRDQIVSATVFEEVAFGPRNLGWDEGRVEAAVARALTRAGLDLAREQPTAALSGGQQQRLALAGVLAMEPRYLILDEASSMLDSAARPALRALVRDLAQRDGVGVVQITHDPYELIEADCVAVMDGGSLLWTGTPRELLGGQGPACARVLLSGGPAEAMRAVLRLGYTPAGPLIPDAAFQWLLNALERGSVTPRDARDVLAVLRGCVADGCRPGARGEGGRASAEVPASGAAAPVLELCDVTFSYAADALVLDRLSVAVTAGEVLLVAGGSGAGKSTFARVATGLYGPERGDVRVGGEPVAPGCCALAFQRPEDQLFLDTVADELAFAPRNLGCDEGEVARRVEAAAALTDLSGEVLERYPFELSGGQARRVAIAAALTLEAPVIVLDEPTAGMDAAGRAALHALVRDLARAGAAVVVISHDLEEWMAVADRVALMAKGRFAWQGSPDALAACPDAFRSCGLEPPEAVRLTAALEAALDGMEAHAAGQRSAERRAAPVGRDEGALRVGRAEDPRDANHEAAAGAGAGARRNSRAARPPAPALAFGALAAADTPASRIDARVKLVLLLAAAIGLFAAPGLALVPAWVVLLVICLAAARMSPRQVLRALAPVAVILVFTLAANAFAFDGSAPVPLWGPVGLNPAGAARGVAAVLRIALLAGFALAVSASTSESRLADGCVRLLRPLGTLGVPVADIGLALSLAMRFVPIVGEEFARIQLAQRARGVVFEGTGIASRLRAWATVLTPLVIGLFRRADRIGEAMAARCYADGAAAVAPPRPLAPRDRAVLVAGLALCVLVPALGWALGIAR